MLNVNKNKWNVKIRDSVEKNLAGWSTTVHLINLGLDVWSWNKTLKPELNKKSWLKMRSNHIGQYYQCVDMLFCFIYFIHFSYSFCLHLSSDFDQLNVDSSSTCFNSYLHVTFQIGRKITQTHTERWDCFYCCKHRKHKHLFISVLFLFHNKSVLQSNFILKKRVNGMKLVRGYQKLHLN